jgi:FKBP-type peptidyl-prolyl cis-trans isomerase FkpA/FKBP-type peptidyl-prolyl cis-trans isomerase FklB
MPKGGHGQGPARSGTAPISCPKAQGRLGSFGLGAGIHPGAGRARPGAEKSTANTHPRLIRDESDFEIPTQEFARVHARLEVPDMQRRLRSAASAGADATTRGSNLRANHCRARPLPRQWRLVPARPAESREFQKMPSVIRYAVLLTAIACSISCSRAAPDKAAEAKAAASAKPVSSAEERRRDSTMIGMDIAKSLEPIKDEVDVQVLADAIKNSFAGKPTGLTPEEAEKVRTAFSGKMQEKMAQKAAEAAQKNLREGAAFLAANAKKPGVRSTASGLEYMVIRPGAGPTPKATDKVRVHYVGTLLDGTKFDSSYDRGEPAEFALNQVIPGWAEAVALMPVNSKYKFWIPSKIGYGPNGQPPIGPNATLVFEVELLAIVP